MHTEKQAADYLLYHACYFALGSDLHISKRKTITIVHFQSIIAKKWNVKMFSPLTEWQSIDEWHTTALQNWVKKTLVQSQQQKCVIIQSPVGRVCTFWIGFSPSFY